jgi:hypothetical protein
LKANLIYFKAQLDSVLTDYPNNGRVFSIRDSTNTFNDNSPSNLLKCVFYEIDRKLFGLVRRSFIRYLIINSEIALKPLFFLKDVLDNIMLKRRFFFVFQFVVHSSVN